MGIYDRPYMRGGGGGGYRPSPGLGLPRPGRVVAGLLIANIAVLVLGLFWQGMARHLGLSAASWWRQPWRFITFQFVHAGGMHLFFNMLGLYFLGMYLELTWGPRRFLVFYLLCGAAGGVAHLVMSYGLGWNPHTLLVGASGGVFAVILACAILYPQIRVIVLFFPMSIRVAAALFIGIAAYSVLAEVRGVGLGGGGISHAAHLGGAVAGALWVYLEPRIWRLRTGGASGRGSGRWRRKVQREQEERQEVDRILDKVRREGIGALSRRERDVLRRATERERHNGGRDGPW
ncbi:MAG: hypothetical protein B1H04_06670 [Planctomycetales bacterium 4484_123]|nr:MAG: hypothetical protein B1H04_06670 [Planctomycetales bacterium 4484_123]